MPLTKNRSSNLSLSHQTALKICQQEIVKYDLRVKAFIQDIRECLGPKEVLSTLNLHVGENMKNLRESVNELERLANELDKPEERNALLNEVENNKKQIGSNLNSLRQANLASHAAINKQNQSELFGEEGTIRKRPIAGKESMINATSNITDSLLSIRRQLASQVQHSELTLNTLEESSSTIEETREEHKNMGSVIQTSRQLLTKYGRRECTDRVLIAVAFLFFFCSVLYVIRERLFS